MASGGDEVEEAKCVRRFHRGGRVADCEPLHTDGEARDCRREQRPDLFGAALPSVGVMDMLRFQKFTIGWAWTSDYGSSDDAAEFKALYAYSPLHHIKPGTKYPAMLIITGDHDDRVVPAHSFKFAATLQAAQAGTKPVLIRIETRAGHGAGKPTSKVIDESADKWAFLVRE